MSLDPLPVTSDLTPRPPTHEVGAAATRSFGGWPRRVAAALALRLVNWCRDDGYWYLTSMAAHAIGLVCLAMISLAIPRSGLTSPEKAPSFDEAEVEQGPADELVGRFEVGETPLDPAGSNATTELLSQMKALPIGSPMGKDDGDADISGNARRRDAADEGTNRTSADWVG